MNRALGAVWHWRNDIVSRIVWSQPMAAAATLMSRQPARRRMPSNGSRDGFGVSDDGACMMDSTHVVARQLTSDFNDLSYNHLKGYLASVQVIVPRTRIAVKGVQHRNRGRKNL